MIALKIVGKGFDSRDSLKMLLNVNFLSDYWTTKGSSCSNSSCCRFLLEVSMNFLHSARKSGGVKRSLRFYLLGGFRAWIYSAFWEKSGALGTRGDRVSMFVMG